MKKNNKKDLTSLTGVSSVVPLLAGESIASESVTKTRRNMAASIERTDRFKNIDDGLIPFKYNTGGYGYNGGYSSMDVRDAVILCQKAYYNVAVFAQVINLMTEFSVGDIFLRSGSSKGREFFDALFDKINLNGFQDQFFREYYRSGNVFIYKTEVELREKEIKNLSQTFGLVSKAASKVSLPAKYIILNPADIQFTGSLSFSSGNYLKLLSDYELSALRRKDRGPDDEAFWQSLSPEVKKQIEQKTGTVSMPLDKNKIQAVFYKKQDYEPFAVPMGFSVLDDINWKLEMKKMDMALTRSVQQLILLVTMGTEPDKGGINQKNLEAMQSLFQNQSIGRVLISDYTTKAQFIVPDIADILDPKKYEIVNADINQGLNNILFGSEKFANQQTKMDVFIARLEQGRRDFIRFLQGEVKRVSRELGLKNYPTIYFDEISLKDDINKMRLYNRLIELNVLTPEEGLTAINTGRLPSVEESIDAQKRFKGLRDEGYYYPLVGGSQKASSDGRPPGSGGGDGSMSGRQAGQIGQSQASFSVNKITENMLLAQKLNISVALEYKKKLKLKKLTTHQEKLATEISNIIIANEDPQNWLAKVVDYCSAPVDKNLERVEQIKELSVKHNVDFYLAGILRASQI